MFSPKEIQILAHLRKNARITLTNIAKQTGIPVSTIFDKIKEQERSVIRKHTTLLDFEILGYSTWVNILLSVDKRSKDDLRRYLEANFNVNTVFHINNGYDFMLECVFKSIKEMDAFFEKMESKYPIIDKRYYFIIDEIKRESFLSDPDIGSP